MQCKKKKNGITKQKQKNPKNKTHYTAMKIQINKMAYELIEPFFLNKWYMKNGKHTTAKHQKGNKQNTKNLK